ncbi:MAG: cis-Golgi t-SNARE syntaxin [Phylliscum demangeonii]|nr:MAG: cis-Golgi t-SNARE syntaxin [Phylliscum demangeonii]
MAVSIQDRTDEFRSVLKQAQKRQSSSKTSSQRHALLTDAQKRDATGSGNEGGGGGGRRARSEFARKAAEIGRGITGTMAKLERLAHLAKKKSLFDDRPVEIAELTYVIKQDLSSLNSQISALQGLSKSARTRALRNASADQEGEHTKNVVVLLQGKLADVSVNFKDVLEVRTKNIQASRSRTENFVSSVSSHSQTMEPPSSGSPLYNTPTQRRTPVSGEGHSHASDVLHLDLDPSSSALARGSAQTDQQLLMMEEAQTTNGYINARGEAIEAIERTIGELGSIFGQLAGMVSEQSEMIQRIDANTEDVVENVQGAQRELMKYWNRLKVIIVGAGIAGLNAAIGLSRAGHDVVILEQSRFTNEVGAAITIGPSATRILTAYGFDYNGAGYIPHEVIASVSGITLQKQFALDFHNVVERYGERYASFHRVDLHNELKRLATAPDGIGRPVDVRLRAKVTGADATSGTVTLADGSTQTADLLIGADGLHSVVQQAINGEYPARDTGSSAFRFLIPTERLMADPVTAALVAGKRNTLYVCPDTSPDAPNRLLVWYECRGGAVQNFVGVCPSKNVDDGAEDYRHTIDKEIMLREFAHYHPDLVRVLAMADDVKLWRLYDREPLPSWVKGKAVVIGDAAHPMLPLAGQAGTQALEDGGALGCLLTHLSSREEVPERLRLFQQVRRNRAAIVQILSSIRLGQEATVTEKIRPYREGKSPIVNSRDAAEHNLRFDVFASCEEALRAAQLPVVSASVS